MRRTTAPSVTGVATRGAGESYWRGPGNVTHEVPGRGRIWREMIGWPMRLVVAMSVGNGRRTSSKFARGAGRIGDVRERWRVTRWVMERILCIRTDGRADL